MQYSGSNTSIWLRIAGSIISGQWNLLLVTEVCVCVCVLTKWGLEESKPVMFWFELEMPAIGCVLNAWSPAPWCYFD